MMFGQSITERAFSRRELLARTARMASGLILGGSKAFSLEAALQGAPAASAPAAGAPPLSPQDDQFLDELERAEFQFFLEQANPQTGLVKDRCNVRGNDTTTVASVAATGFGLTALCIGEKRKWISLHDARERVLTTLRSLWRKLPNHRGFFFHYADVNTGARLWDSEVSSIDTAILLCGVLTCRQHFFNTEIRRLALAIFNRVEWNWLAEDTPLLSLGWMPEMGFLPYRWQDYSELTKLVTAESGVILATPQIQVTGIVSNGTTSTIFIALGVVPKDDKTIKGAWSFSGPIKGQGLQENKPYGVEVAQDLARYLDLKAGKDGVVMSTTLAGQMNAMDMQVLGVYDSGSDATNDKYMRFTFGFAQSLVDTKMAEKIVVLLDDWRKTEKMRPLLLAKLSAAGISSEIRTWSELSLFYSKTKSMFDVIFLFLFTIVLVIVVMSTVNTMSMAVLERTREIGTLRALGLKRRGVSQLFALEGGILGFLGSFLGIVVHLTVWVVIREISPSYTPPGISTPVPLVVQLVPQTLVALLLFLVLLSLIAAIIPARRAAKQNVVDALGHV